MVRTLRRPSAPPARAAAPAARRGTRPAEPDYDEPDSGVEERPVRGARTVRRQASEEEPLRSRPSRSRPRPVEEDDEPDERPRGRGRSSRDDDDDDRPSRRSGRSREDERPKVDTSGGWDKWRSEKSKSGGFPDGFKPEMKQTYLIKFLEDAPFSTFGQHWLNEIKDGKRSFVCIGEDCPMCDELGNRPRAMAYFNIVLFEEKKQGREYVLEPTLKVWETGPQIANELDAIVGDLEERGQTLADVYVTVRKTETGSGKSRKTHWNIKDIKERDVRDDWQMEPLSDDELDEFEDKMYDESIVKPSSRRELEDVVDALMGGED